MGVRKEKHERRTYIVYIISMEEKVKMNKLAGLCPDFNFDGGLISSGLLSPCTMRTLADEYLAERPSATW